LTIRFQKKSHTIPGSVEVLLKLHKKVILPMRFLKDEWRIFQRAMNGTDYFFIGGYIYG